MRERPIRVRDDATFRRRAGALIDQLGMEE
jgi:hypothetical protein